MALTALVYNVMYSTSKVLSFGTGQFAMVGGICTAWLVLGLHLPLWLGFVACLASGAVFGWLAEFIAVRRIVAASDEHLWVLSTLALSTMVQEAMSIWWECPTRRRFRGYFRRNSPAVSTRNSGFP